MQQQTTQPRAFPVIFDLTRMVRCIKTAGQDWAFKAANHPTTQGMQLHGYKVAQEMPDGHSSSSSSDSSAQCS